MLRGVLQIHKDDEIIDYIEAQNKQIFSGIIEEERRMTVKRRKTARNPHLQNIILQVSPTIWRRMVEVGRVHVELQRVVVHDQSPLIQCTNCLGYGHTRKYCESTKEVCAHCGEEHKKADCQKYKAGDPPMCVNCTMLNVNADHNAFDTDCPTRARWEAMARSTVAVLLRAPTGDRMAT
ncbi:unnamed protein product [Pieris macdunnoughi]|uniref:Nucleic-acid-binding protein from mobile element jockey n=1 Tax=Pieris macdunnoughi TaxID=345717 RepID=A0A821XYB2_9NEOP|nr:unnamed protein product [Pieris macdunnoughi]